MELVEDLHSGFFESVELKVKRARYRVFKRVSDLFFALLLLPFLLPLLGFIALLIKFNSQGPIFFLHRRIGRDGRSFQCYKFRTMVENAPEILENVLKDQEAQEEWKKDFKLKHDPRITWIGKILRKTSLDELPQIFNVMKGEMSFVGPRPIVQEEISRYGRNYKYYRNILPGITGLWQVSGRNDMDYEQRVALDKFYAQNQGFWLDLKILLKTIPIVLFRKGAY